MQFLSFDKKDIINGRSENIVIDDMDCFLALYNCNVHWIVPKTGKKCGDIPGSTQFLLWKTKNGRYGVMLPLINGDLKAAVCGCENGIYISIQGAMAGEEPDSAELLYIEYGSDPYGLTNSAVKHISEKLGSFKMRIDKKTPGFIDKIC